jgi:outer membrane protein, heavy metal efflux system
MRSRLPSSAAGLAALLCIAAPCCFSQQALTWAQVKARFETSNPALRADSLSVDEQRAEEITASLRPNPQFTQTFDGTQIAPQDGHWQPLTGTMVQPGISYLHERDHKRELRIESAQEATRISATQREDLQRNLEFDLRTAFNNALEQKAILQLAQADLDDYDHVIQVSRERFRTGDIARIDLDRIELQRVQYESEIQQAIANLRTSKIQLMQLMNDHTAVEHFDIQGTFDFTDALKPLDEFRNAALDARPDLRAAMETMQQARTNHKLAVANGSTDPTFGGWYTWNASTNNPAANQTVGVSLSIPLRIFDRNQGEKQRTLIDIQRSEASSEAVRAQVFSDVDSAYVQAESAIKLLVPYKAQYKDQSSRVRDAVTYSYQHGGASLLDMLTAQSDYRQVQLSYLQLIGSYLNSVAQLNLAVGREVIP